MLLALLSGLTACAASTSGDIQPPPASLMVACAQPQALPVRDVQQAEAEVFWGRDRAALRDCAERHALLVQHTIRQAQPQ